MLDSLSIRAYTPIICSHEHGFHQIVLPLHGVIEITVSGNHGLVGPGQVVIIPKGVEHSFQAQEEARFLIADLSELPNNAYSLNTPFASISSAMQSYCDFIDTQLQHQINTDLEATMVLLFKQLLLDQEFSPKIDNRITRVLAHIESNFSNRCSLEELASICNLSVSHFKVEFKNQTGKTAGEFLLQQRMEKARALLNHTDYPIQIVAERVGYRSLSAFSRRFSEYFGKSPSWFKSH